MNELKIIIAGERNTGKSTMMLQIEKLLKEHGYNVELEFDEPDYTGEENYYFHNKESLNFDTKIEKIKSDTTIKITEKQLKRLNVI